MKEAATCGGLSQGRAARIEIARRPAHQVAGRLADLDDGQPFKLGNLPDRKCPLPQ